MQKLLLRVVGLITLEHLRVLSGVVPSIYTATLDLCS
jgi:hypothetical protein